MNSHMDKAVDKMAPYIVAVVVFCVVFFVCGMITGVFSDCKYERSLTKYNPAFWAGCQLVVADADR